MESEANGLVMKDAPDAKKSAASSTNVRGLRDGIDVRR
jgi:hypothetical protein